jgi:DNA-binding CsgD family transcriptional regulator
MYCFILYRPKTKIAKKQIIYNVEAEKIFSYPASSLEEGKTSLPDLSSFCSRWKVLLDKRIKVLRGGHKEEDPESDFIDVLRSGKRQYTVKGVVLSANPYSLQEKEEQYIFILERFNQDKVNFPLIFRQWNLSRREQDIVRLLLEGRYNKEIANNLNLSPNTVKSYMKLLSRKVGVSGRTGLIGRLLTGR